MRADFAPEILRVILTGGDEANTLVIDLKLLLLM
jgi:hypothetical protein